MTEIERQNAAEIEDGGRPDHRVGRNRHPIRVSHRRGSRYPLVAGQMTITGSGVDHDVRLGFDADEQASFYERADRAGSRH
ncbi:hypothetical protein ACLMAJ_32065 [Nocardia sp. KC 131]|uniref:hypothetical protein n=1 Tax=Nocardia arseniciresistens TaxID=3392119 RepID=UPI00398EE957